MDRLNLLWNITFAIFILSGIALIVIATFIHKTVWGTWL